MEPREIEVPQWWLRLRNQLIHSYSYRRQMDQISVQFEREPQRCKG